VIEFRDVSFRYPTSAEPVVSNLNIVVNSGEHVVVMGANGCGKTTLALLAAQLLRPSTGEVVTDSEKRPGIVLQNPDNQIVTISVERELAFPLECRQFEPASIRDIVLQTAEAMNFSDKLVMSPFDLSGGEKQKLAAATACIVGADILILDEPFSYLDEFGKRLFSESMDRIVHESGASIIEISQDSSTAFDADRLVLMKNGEIVADGQPRELFGDSQLLETCSVDVPDEILLEHIHQFTPVEVSDPTCNAPSEIDNYLIEIEDLSFAWSEKQPLFENLNIGIERGGCIALAGASGVGKTTLAQMIAGLRDYSSGRIMLNGREATGEELRNSVSYLFQFPERQIFESTVEREIGFGLKNVGLNSSERRERIREYLERVGFDYDSFHDRMPTLLSGGEMRRVATASLIAMKKPILILDEPTAELDRDSKENLRETIRLNSEAGITQIIISHDTDFLFDVCDSFIVLSTGFVRFSGRREDLLEEPGVFTDCGLAVPHIVELAERDDWRRTILTYGLTSIRSVFRVCNLNS